MAGIVRHSADNPQSPIGAYPERTVSRRPDLIDAVQVAPLAATLRLPGFDAKQSGGSSREEPPAGGLAQREKRDVGQMERTHVRAARVLELERGRLEDPQMMDVDLLDVQGVAAPEGRS